MNLAGIDELSSTLSEMQIGLRVIAKKSQKYIKMGKNSEAHNFVSTHLGDFQKVAFEVFLGVLDDGLIN